VSEPESAPASTHQAQAPWVRAWIGLGANLGDAHLTLQQAVRELAGLPRTQCVATSSLWKSAPIDAQGPDFLNAVVALDTQLTALELLAKLQDIEKVHGRLRPFVNAPRTLDLDVLLYGDTTLSAPGLQVPHPRMHQRAFVLAPLHELAPDLQIPGRGPVRILLDAVKDQALQRQGPLMEE